MSEIEKHIRSVEAAINEELAKLPRIIVPRMSFRDDAEVEALVEERLPTGWNYHIIKAIGHPLRIAITTIEPESAAQIGIEE